MKTPERAHAIGAALFSLPFLAVIGISVWVVWVGDVEMITAGVVLLPAVLYFIGARWWRYVVGVFSALSFLVASIIPFSRGTEGKYFWLIWAPIWLVFACAAFLSFVPDRARRPGTADAGR